MNLYSESRVVPKSELNHLVQVFSAVLSTSNMDIKSNRKSQLIINNNFIFVDSWFIIFNDNLQVGSVELNVAHGSIAKGTEEKMLPNG